MSELDDMNDAVVREYQHLRSGARPSTAAHGTRARYTAGCSCEACKSANAEYIRRTRGGSWAGRGPRPRGPVQLHVAVGDLVAPRLLHVPVAAVPARAVCGRALSHADGDSVPVGEADPELICASCASVAREVLEHAG